LGDDLLTPLQRKTGLPIGNLTSQFFANIYLNHFDHFVQEKLKIDKYVRYVDDFALFADNRLFLEDARQQIEEYLAILRLKIHPIKSQLFETKKGANFLGFRVFPDRIRVRADNLKRGRRRLKKLQADYVRGNLSIDFVDRSVQGWFAHLEHGDTRKLQQQISASLTWMRE
jgi:RNA-directed DNA polymerase